MSISAKKVNKRVSNWQRCNREQIAGLFYAYDESQKRTERVASYKLSTADMQRLSELDLSLSYQFSFMLAAKRRRKSAQIGNTPVFSPILALYYTPLNKKEVVEYFEMEWEPNPHFLDSGEPANILSGIDAIPAAGAFLFVFNWLKQAYEQLPLAFESDAGSSLGRVRSYFYSPPESQIIMEDIKAHFDSNSDIEVSIYAHLGVGISVQYHPFSFRPVLELHRKNKASKNTFETLTNSSFFDFSRPCPHFCKD